MFIKIGDLNPISVIDELTDITDKNTKLSMDKVVKNIRNNPKNDSYKIKNSVKN